MFDPDLLRAFVTVADCGGFSRAAERLNSTQSTVSHQIKRLERQAGRTFLNRTTRALSLTEDGEILIGYARRFLQLIEDATEHLGSPKLGGVLRFGASDDFAAQCLPEILSRFRRIHPDVHLTAEIGVSRALVERLGAGDLDLALVRRPAGETGGEVVFRDRIVWAAAPDLRLEPGAPVPLALFPQPCVYRAAALGALERAGRAWEVVYACPSLAGVQAAVRAGLGVTPLAGRFLGSGLVRADGVGLPDLPDVEFALYSVASKRVAPAARVFGELVRSWLAQHPTGDGFGAPELLMWRNPAARARAGLR
ncbi:LysR substrate-binding domain-containing protein [Hansschlegelia sp.]|uniref:LysR substrate-binding domain-containing protein n=1 Tax=Hansschlegelia sp. TaxID=2041892 RepID=UPI002C530B76|nr:LysR substrate-binding domain-containing protein [Hansschlegelia sp.]HVI28836.1 LysR substrate-binding domain-containing protein [Hansschlegelia sp.]